MPRPPDALPTLDHLHHANLAAQPLASNEINAIRSVLDRLVAASQTLVPPTPTDLMTIREAASLAGLTPGTLKRWIYTGVITRYGRPSCYRVSWADVMPRAPYRRGERPVPNAWQPGQGRHPEPYRRPRRKQQRQPKKTARQTQIA